MSDKLTTIAAAVAMTLGGAAASAADLNDTFNIRSYGTLGVVHSDEDQADFVASGGTQPEGAGYTDEWSAAVDSKFALQVDAQFSERLSGVVQLVSEGAFNNSWDGDANKRFFPSLEWANLSYKVTDELTVRGGRIVLPFLMTSEYKKVGYANHWMRAPVEVYSIPFSSSDGLDVSYRSSIGSATNTARIYAGTQSIRTDTFKSQVELWGFNETFERNSLTLRAAYLHVHMETPGAGFGPLLDAIATAADALGAAGANAAREARRTKALYDTSEQQTIELYDVGVMYDPGSWFVMAEAVHLESAGLVPGSTNGFISSGMRIQGFTPYVTFARSKTDQKDEQGIPLTGLPFPAGLGVSVPGAMANAIILPIVNSNLSQKSFSAGLRWDAAKNVALKFQYDLVDLDNGSNGLLGNVQPGFESGSSLNVFSLAVDYVF